jgi:hypothetical protein
MLTNVSLQLNFGAGEHFAKIRNEAALDHITVELAAQKTRERSDAPVGNSARNDQVEVGQVCRHIEGKSVTCHPP